MDGYMSAIVDISHDCIARNGLAAVAEGVAVLYCVFVEYQYLLAVEVCIDDRFGVGIGLLVALAKEEEFFPSCDCRFLLE